MIRLVSKFSPLIGGSCRKAALVFAFDGEVSLGLSPESQEAAAWTLSTEVAINLTPEHAEAVAFAETVVALFLLTPEHSESRTLAEVGEVLLALLPEHLEPMSVVISGMVSINLDVTAQLSFSLDILADLVFSLVPEAVSKMTSLDEFFKAYSAILYKDSFTAVLIPTHPRMAELSRQGMDA